MSDASIHGAPSVGRPAPPLVLPDENGTTRDLAHERGHWVVLFFYPKDFTPGCTTESCEFRDLTPEFEMAGARVWSVSVLGSESKARFKAEHGLTYTLLADEDHAVSERYGVWVEKQNYGKTYRGIERTTFLIDPDGRIAHVWPKVKAAGHAAEVLATVQALATS
jgi:thioredoxin-dependent peroxiredoxin